MNNPASTLPPPADMDNVDVTEVTKGLVKLMKLDEQSGKQAQTLVEGIMSGSALSDLCGLSHEDLELIYSIGRTYYQNSKYDDAETIFRFITVMEYSEAKYWMALGAVLQMKKDYEEALKAYGYGAMLNIDDPRPHLQAGFCFLQLGHYEAATNALEASLLAPDATESTKLQANALLAKVESESADTAN